MTSPITFTPHAADYIKKRITKEEGVGFRLSVKKTGCSGYAYLPTVIKQVNQADFHFTLTNGVNLFIDVAWLDLLQGLQIDYQEEDKSGLKQKRLIFINPKETSRCGCGDSFHVE